jgi:hypothetical protein
MLSSLQRADQRVDVNCGPLSLVMVEGRPNPCIQPAKRSAAQSAADVEERGIASGHLVVLSIIVKRWL